MKATDEKIAFVLAGKRAHRTIQLPGSTKEAGLMVAVRALTEAEMDLARQQAQIRLRRWSEGKRYDPTTVVDIDPSLFNRWVEREIVFAAFFDAEKPSERFFPTVQDVELLDATTLSMFMRAFEDHQATVCPPETMTDEEVRTFAEALGNASSASAELHRFERSTLVRLLLSMASLLRSTTSPTTR